MNSIYALLLFMSAVGVAVVLIVRSSEYAAKMNSCIIKCGAGCNPILRKLLLDWNGKVKQEYQREQLCLFNWWNLSHVILYMILSVLFPQHRLLMFLIGIFWETSEVLCGHHNNLDPLWNGIGILIGMMIRP